MRNTTIGLAVLLGLTAATSELFAQNRGLVDVTPLSPRRGFWLEGGLGWGQESYRFANEPYSASLGKPTFVVRLGGTPGTKLRLGGEGTVWVYSYQDDNAENITETLWSVMGIGRLYPSRKQGLFLKGGAGLGISAVSVQYGTGTSETGFAWMVGAGWEIQVGKQVFITPGVDWYHHSYQKRNEDTLDERLLNFSLAVTWQPGR